MGKEGKYDLKLAEPPPAPESDGDSDSGDEEKALIGAGNISPKNIVQGSKNVRGILKKVCYQLLRCLSLCTGMHSDRAQNDAVSTLCGLMRTVVQMGCTHDQPGKMCPYTMNNIVSFVLHFLCVHISRF